MAITAAANGTQGDATAAVIPPPLSATTITQRVVKAEYAVRGEIVRRASVIEEELLKQQQQQASGDNNSSSSSKFPFSKVVWCNIGNPQILGQAPITYFRQVLCLCEYPQVCVSSNCVCLWVL